MTDSQTGAGVEALPITLFADFTCPFCYVTEAAVRRRAAGGGVAVSYRAFELFPAPAPISAPDEEPSWVAEVQPLADALDLPLRIPDFQPRTRKAHEAARFAEAHGVGAAMRSRIYSAFWSEGADIGRIDVLAALVAEVGVDPAELKIALDIDRFRDDVLRDQALARELRIPGIPTLFLGTGSEARVLVGLQSPSALDAALSGEYEL